MNFSHGAKVDDFTIAEDNTSIVFKRTVWRKNSALEYIGFFKNDMPIGMHHYYDKDGNPLKTVRYGDNGEVI